MHNSVIQGSCLGPLLFLLYINDITDIIAPTIAIKMYADDVKLYTEINSDKSRTALQQTLDQIHCWSTTWQLPISLAKCCVMNISKTSEEAETTFKLGDSILPYSNEVRDLGVIVDNHLTFDSYINQIVKKAYSRANLIRRCFISKHLPTLLQAYKVFVRPLLEYNTSVWSPHSIQHITAIENVQRRFTKCLPGLSDLPYHQRLAKLNLDSLELRRIRTDLIVLYKIVFGLISTDIAHYFKLNTNINSFNLRRHIYQLVNLPCKHSVCKYFYVYKIIPTWNDLPPILVNFGSLSRFKKSLTNEILAKYCKVTF